MKRTRIGTVRYLNAAPLTSEIDRERYELVADHPRGISKKLVAGEVAVALVPVAAVLEDGDFRIVPGWCIGADGPVGSVLLVAECPPEQWTHVVLDGESRTSVILAQLLLTEGPLAARVGTLDVRTVAPGEGVELARGTTAAVVIGDAARTLPARLTERLDLAELWKQWTGRPFVFAVWAGADEVDDELISELRRAGAAGVAGLAARYEGADLHYLTQNLRYPMDDEALMGLRRFASLAFRAGLVRTEHLSQYPPPRVARALPVEVDESLAAAAGGMAPTQDQARAWLVHLRDADLHVAAHARRQELFGAKHASYLVRPVLSASWRDELEAAREAGAAAVRVPGAADNLHEMLDGLGEVALEGVALHELPGSVPVAIEVLSRKGLRGVGWWVGEDPAELEEALQAAADASVAVEAVVRLSRGVDVIDQLWSVRAMLGCRAITSVRVTVELPVGSLVEPGQATTARWMRAVSLARLVLPEVPHVSVDPSAVGADASQAALFVGADDYGAVGAGVQPVEGVARFEVGLEEAERVLRVAGLEPVRRELGFDSVGGPLTRLRKIRPPLERAPL